MRYRQFLSELGEEVRQKWTCEYCLEHKLNSARNCPVLSEEDVISLGGTGLDVARNKYAFKRPEKSNKENESNKKREPFVIKHGDFMFTECPVPILSDELMTMEDRNALFVCDIVNWSETTGCMPVPGGLLDQANTFYESRIIVLGEQNKIEKEKYDEMNKNTPKTPKGAGPSTRRLNQ